MSSKSKNITLMSDKYCKDRPHLDYLIKQIGTTYNDKSHNTCLNYFDQRFYKVYFDIEMFQNATTMIYLISYVFGNPFPVLFKFCLQ